MRQNYLPLHRKLKWPTNPPRPPPLPRCGDVSFQLPSTFPYPQGTWGILIVGWLSLLREVSGSRTDVTSADSGSLVVATDPKHVFIQMILRVHTCTLVASPG